MEQTLERVQGSHAREIIVMKEKLEKSLLELEQSKEEKAELLNKVPRAASLY